MGEAKVRREALRLKLLERSEEWEFPPSAWEAEVCAELKEDDVVVVPRVASPDLAWMRMPTNQCHANVRWYAENDPEKLSRAVAGWWVQWPNFVLHSVVERAGKMFCVTPTPFEVAEFPFIPDPKISWIEDEKVYSAFRSGREIGPGVRVFPAFTMAQSAIIRERLLAGCDPRKAGDFTEQEMEELKRKYIVGRD